MYQIKHAAEIKELKDWLVSHWDRIMDYCSNQDVPKDSRLKLDDYFDSPEMLYPLLEWAMYFRKDRAWMAEKQNLMLVYNLIAEACRIGGV